MTTLTSAEDTATAREILHRVIDEASFSADDLRFLLVISAGFMAVPPGSLFQLLRSGPESTPNSAAALDPAATESGSQA